MGEEAPPRLSVKCRKALYPPGGALEPGSLCTHTCSASMASWLTYPLTCKR